MAASHLIEGHGAAVVEEEAREAARLQTAGQKEAAAYLKWKEELAEKGLQDAIKAGDETETSRAKRDIMAWKLICRTEEGTKLDDLLEEMGVGNAQDGKQQRSRVLNAYHKTAREIQAFCDNLLTHARLQSNTRQQALVRGCRRRRKKRNGKATGTSPNEELGIHGADVEESDGNVGPGSIVGPGSKDVMYVRVSKLETTGHAGHEWSSASGSEPSNYYNANSTCMPDAARSSVMSKSLDPAFIATDSASEMDKIEGRSTSAPIFHLHSSDRHWGKGWSMARQTEPADMRAASFPSSGVRGRNKIHRCAWSCGELQHHPEPAK